MPCFYRLKLLVLRQVSSKLVYINKKLEAEAIKKELNELAILIAQLKSSLKVLEANGGNKHVGGLVVAIKYEISRLEGLLIKKSPN